MVIPAGGVSKAYTNPFPSSAWARFTDKVSPSGTDAGKTVGESELGAMLSKVNEIPGEAELLCPPILWVAERE
jgi:hypothetical protein